MPVMCNKVGVNKRKNREYIDGEPKAMDILCGNKSRRFREHAGSIRFARIVESSQHLYNEAKTKHEKSLVIHNVAKIAQLGGSRFLLRDISQNRWYLASRRAVLDKVGHSLRNNDNDKKQTFVLPTTCLPTQCLSREISLESCNPPDSPSFKTPSATESVTPAPSPTNVIPEVQNAGTDIIIDSWYVSWKRHVAQFWETGVIGPSPIINDTSSQDEDSEEGSSSSVEHSGCHTSREDHTQEAEAICSSFAPALFDSTPNPLDKSKNLEYDVSWMNRLMSVDLPVM